ncbi:MAG: sigma-70 family RNA polymerase sigma factor [Planctomycetota bacterium]
MQEIPQTRASLLLQLSERSDDAWTEFLAVYEKALLKFCFSKGLQEADCEDVIQDVLLAVINKISDWDPDEGKGRFRGWLFRVARNVAVDVIDLRAKKAAASGDSQVARMLAEIPADSTPEASFEMDYQRALFDWASQQVKSEVQEITWLSFRKTAVEGKKAEQVSQELGVPVGSVYTAKCRVVARIRAKIAELDEGIDLKLGAE